MKNLSFDFVEATHPVTEQPQNGPVHKIKVLDEQTAAEEKLSLEIDNYFFSHAEGYVEQNLAPLRISRRRKKSTYHNSLGAKKTFSFKKLTPHFVTFKNNASANAVSAQNTAHRAGSKFHAVLSSGILTIRASLKKHGLVALVLINIIATLILAYTLFAMQQNVGAASTVSLNSENIKTQSSQIESLRMSQEAQAVVQNARQLQQQNQLNCLSTQQFLSEQEKVRTLWPSERETLRKSCAN